MPGFQPVVSILFALCLLSGCTGPTPDSDAMLASTYDLPAGVRLMPISDSHFDDYKAMLGLKENPGVADLPEAGPDGPENVPTRMAAAVLMREAPERLTFLSVSYTRPAGIPAQSNPAECDKGRPMWVLVSGNEVAEVRLQTPNYDFSSQTTSTNPSDSAQTGALRAALISDPAPSPAQPSQALLGQAWSDVDAMGAAIQAATGATRVC